MSSHDKILSWLEEAAKDNVLDAKLTLGNEYLEGMRFEQNAEQGFALVLASAIEAMDHAQVLAAWLLNTYPDEKYRDYDRAVERGDWRAAKKSLKNLTE